MSALDWLMQRLGGDPEAEAAARTSAVIKRQLGEGAF
jgi:hypothetical protein